MKSKRVRVTTQKASPNTFRRFSMLGLHSIGGGTRGSIDSSIMEFSLEDIMTNPGFFAIKTRILKYLNSQDLEELCEIWRKDEQLNRMSWIKYMDDFGDSKNIWFIARKVQTFFPGWQEAVRKVGANASIEDLREIKDWFKEHRHIYLRNPVHNIARTGRVKVMEFILQTSYNCNSFGDCGQSVFHAACLSRSLEMVQLIIRSPKERKINLNILTADFNTAFELACFSGSFDTVRFLLENYKELGINIKKRNGLGQTALDLLDFPDEECRKLRHQVQLEFTKIEMSKIARIQNKRIREQRQRHVCTIPSKRPAPLSKKPRIDEE